MNLKEFLVYVTVGYAYCLSEDCKYGGYQQASVYHAGDNEINRMQKVNICH